LYHLQKEEADYKRKKLANMKTIQISEELIKFKQKDKFLGITTTRSQTSLEQAYSGNCQ